MAISNSTSKSTASQPPAPPNLLYGNDLRDRTTYRRNGCKVVTWLENGFGYSEYAYRIDLKKIHRFPTEIARDKALTTALGDDKPDPPAAPAMLMLPAPSRYLSMRATRLSFSRIAARHGKTKVKKSQPSGPIIYLPAPKTPTKEIPAICFICKDAPATKGVEKGSPVCEGCIADRKGKHLSAAKKFLDYQRDTSKYSKSRKATKPQLGWLLDLPENRWAGEISEASLRELCMMTTGNQPEAMSQAGISAMLAFCDRPEGYRKVREVLGRAA